MDKNKNEIRAAKLREYESAQIEQTKAALDYLAMMTEVELNPESTNVEVKDE